MSRQVIRLDIDPEVGAYLQQALYLVCELSSAEEAGKLLTAYPALARHLPELVEKFNEIFPPEERAVVFNPTVNKLLSTSNVGALTDILVAPYLQTLDSTSYEELKAEAARHIGDFKETIVEGVIKAFSHSLADGVEQAARQFDERKVLFSDLLASKSAELSLLQSAVDELGSQSAYANQAEREQIVAYRHTLAMKADLFREQADELKEAEARFNIHLQSARESYDWIDSSHVDPENPSLDLLNEKTEALKAQYAAASSELGLARASLESALKALNDTSLDLLGGIRRALTALAEGRARRWAAEVNSSLEVIEGFSAKLGSEISELESLEKKDTESLRPIAVLITRLKRNKTKIDSDLSLLREATSLEKDTIQTALSRARSLGNELNLEFATLREKLLAANEVDDVGSVASQNVLGDSLAASSLEGEHASADAETLAFEARSLGSSNLSSSVLGSVGASPEDDATVAHAGRELPHMSSALVEEDEEGLDGEEDDVEVRVLGELGDDVSTDGDSSGEHAEAGSSQSAAGQIPASQVHMPNTNPPGFFGDLAVQDQPVLATPLHSSRRIVEELRADRAVSDDEETSSRASFASAMSGEELAVLLRADAGAAGQILASSALPNPNPAADSLGALRAQGEDAALAPGDLDSFLGAARLRAPQNPQRGFDSERRADHIQQAFSLNSFGAEHYKKARQTIREQKIKDSWLEDAELSRLVKFKRALLLGPSLLVSTDTRKAWLRKWKKSKLTLVLASVLTMLTPLFYPFFYGIAQFLTALVSKKWLDTFLRFLGLAVGAAAGIAVFLFVPSSAMIAAAGFIGAFIPGVNVAIISIAAIVLAALLVSSLAQVFVVLGGKVIDENRLVQQILNQNFDGTEDSAAKSEALIYIAHRQSDLEAIFGKLPDQDMNELAAYREAIESGDSQNPTQYSAFLEDLRLKAAIPLLANLEPELRPERLSVNSHAAGAVAQHSREAVRAADESQSSDERKPLLP